MSEYRSRYSDEATGWAVWGSNPDTKNRYLCPPKCPDRCSLLFSGYRGSFSVAKRSVCDAGHSPPPSSWMKNEWSCTATCPMCLHDVDSDSFLHATVQINFRHGLCAPLYEPSCPRSTPEVTRWHFSQSTDCAVFSEGLT